MEAFQEGYHVMKTHPQLPDALGSLYNSLYGPGATGADSGILQKHDYKNIGTRDAIDAQIKHMERLSEGMAGMCQAKEIEIAKSLRDADLPGDPVVAIPQWYGLVQEKIYKELTARGEKVPDLNAVNVSDPVHAV